MDRKYTGNQTARHRMGSEEERFLCEQFVWIKGHMDVLEVIEEKLKQVRTLALYVVENELNEEEKSQIQLEVDELLRKITFLNQKENTIYN